MANLEDDILKGAEWISQALQSSGYKADFSLESIGEIERFFVEQMKDGKPIENGLLADDIGNKLFSLGSYIGEVLRRAYSGAWLVDNSDPEGELNVALRLSSGAELWPIQKVMKRFQNGEEDNLKAYTKSFAI
ncbi:MAG TPA: hypothetical protein VHD37_02950 [Candidatus Paceibacterota bacterium]|nr:hypothetical protein [Candidatus Paceibacterota bacterium]